MPEEQNHTEDTTTQNGGWGAFSSFKKSGNTATNKGFSNLTKLLIFLMPALLFATFYQYSVVKGSTFFGLSLRHNINLESGLVGYWTFDGPDMSSTTAYDMSGNGNDGTINGASTAIGKLGQSLDFDDTDYVCMPTFNESFSEITIAAWVRPESYNAYNGIVYSRAWPEISGLQLSENYPGTTLAYVWDNGVQWDSNLELLQSEWSFVALTISPSLGTVYVGTSINLSSATNAVAHDTAILNDLCIGMDWDGPSHWDGNIDDVRIYNRALSAKEIEALYKQGEGSKISVTPPTTPSLENGLVSHLTFDGPNMTTASVTDMSNNGNYGDVYGSTPVIGKLGQALQFDGVDDSVYINTIPDLTGATDVPFSWSFWIMPADNTDEIIGWGALRRCRLTNVSANLGIGCTLAGDEYNLSAVNSTTIVSDNQWHHVVYTHNSGVQKLYVDGQLEDTGSEVFGTGSADILLGTRAFGGYHEGKIDDVRIYSRDITADEVTQLYNLGR